MIDRFLDEWMTIVEIMSCFFSSCFLDTFGVTLTGLLEELERKPELEVTLR